jgi:hypothetical protein
VLNQDSSESSTPSSHFLFIDESGDFNFTDSGTKHFVMAGVLTKNPLKSARPLQDLRYQLLAKGINLSSFHAAPDLQIVRDLVFNEIAQMSDIEIHVVSGEKGQLDPSIRNMKDLHFEFTLALMQFHLDRWNISGFNQLVVVIDRSLPIKDQVAFRSSIKKLIKRYRMQFQIYFQSMKTDYNGQIADYVAWAKFKQLERGEHRPWQALSKSLVITESEVRG